MKENDPYQAPEPVFDHIRYSNQLRNHKFALFLLIFEIWLYLQHNLPENFDSNLISVIIHSVQKNIMK